MPFLTSHYYNKYVWESFYYLYIMRIIYPENNSIQLIIDTHYADTLISFGKLYILNFGFFS